jgi:hypothetical protein
VLCVMLLTEVSLERSKNTTQPKQDPRVCLSVCLSFQRETRLRSQGQTQEKEGKKKKKNETETKTKQRKSSTQQIQFFFCSGQTRFLSFFLSRPPPPQSSSHSALMDGLTCKI